MAALAAGDLMAFLSSGSLVWKPMRAHLHCAIITNPLDNSCRYEQHISEEVRQCLRLSSFDSMLWSDEEILLLLQFMFTDLGLIESIPLDMTVLRNFLFQVYKNYNEVPFHNFRHCFCVAQMVSVFKQ
ncbi:unnamed protein product [Nezara viridula]|uniref:PDEase domain-containing protein n=1 Tax=Nezara viridula TaxID=85310 RepID=A0A9P0H587_NEZVI|nr:unnamed protein product [Nezara viridula]